METRTRLRTALGSALTVLVSTLVTLALVEGILRIVWRPGRPGPPRPTTARRFVAGSSARGVS